MIEDAPEMVETITLCLTIRWPDISVLSTANGKKALIILDLGLPDVDGLQVLQACCWY